VGSLVKVDIEFVDLAGELVAVMSDHESVMDENLERGFRRNSLGEAALS
jgi:hypothetical protein